MPAGKLNPVLRHLLRAPAFLYRWHCGWLLGHRFLLLTHTGRRTGRQYRTVLEVMDYRLDGPELVVMSGWGRNADWLRNIQASAKAEITVGTSHFTACHHQLVPEEAARVVAAYERRHRLATPLIRAVLTRLLGWRYDGSAAARRRLVTQLPLIAFRARS